MTNNYTNHPDYDQLPEVIKTVYSHKEYAWLSDDEKARLIETECNPEVPEVEED